MSNKKDFIMILRFVHVVCELFHKNVSLNLNMPLAGVFHVCRVRAKTNHGVLSRVSSIETQCLCEPYEACLPPDESSLNRAVKRQQLADKKAPTGEKP